MGYHTERCLEEADKAETLEQKILWWLEAEDAIRLDSDGGYPAEISTEIRGYVIIATVDHDDAPTLKVHKWKDLKARYRRALKRWAYYDAEEEWLYCWMES